MSSYRCFWKRTICTRLTWRTSINGCSKRPCAILILSNTFNHCHGGVRCVAERDCAGGWADSRLHRHYGGYAGRVGNHAGGHGLGQHFLGLWLQSALIGFTMQIMGIIIFVLVYGRMLEIYLLTSSGPSPRCYAFQPGAGRRRAELPQIPVCRRLSRAADTGMCCDLRGARSGHRNRRRSDRGDMGNRRLYGSVVLHAL